MLKVTKIDENTFDVNVTGEVSTTHRVMLNDNYYQDLTLGKISKEQLIEESFNFLLKRESNTQILREFTLEIIERYFPEYPAEIRKRI